MEEAWYTRLRQWREALGVTREQLGRRAGVAATTIKAYELGIRHPTRETAVAILEALSVEPVERNGILLDLGFASDPRKTARHLPDPEHSLAEARAEIEAMPWPAHLSNELMDVIGANHLAEALWGVDLEHEFTAPVARNLFASLSSPRFADRLVNWNEAMELLLSLVKGSFGEPQEAGTSNQYHSAVFAQFLAGDPHYVQSAIKIWARVEPRILKWRFTYPVVWRDPDAGVLRFLVTVNPVNRTEHITVNDWIPVDAATWEGLAKVQQRPARESGPLQPAAKLHS